MSWLRRRPDADVNAIVHQAALDVFGPHAEDSLCLAFDHPDHNGGWVCDMPAGHAGAHQAHGGGNVVLNVWVNDERPAYGLPRVRQCSSSYQMHDHLLSCEKQAGHDGDHAAHCGCQWAADL